jgi:hypothetical protein
MIGTDAIIEYNSGAVTRMLRTVRLGGGFPQDCVLISSR